MFSIKDGFKAIINQVSAVKRMFVCKGGGQKSWIRTDVVVDLKVNFTNVLHAAFTYVSCTRSFFVLTS